MIEIRIPVEDDVAELFRFDGRAFGHSWDEAEASTERAVIDLERFRIAVAGGRIVAAAGSFGMNVTLPGPVPTPMGGLTWVAVDVTHRRRGLLRRLLDDIHRDIADRSEPLVGLTASEGSIYERFGYGPVTWHAKVDVDVARGGVDPVRVPRGAPDDVEVVGRADVDDLDARLADIFSRHARARVGEVDRSVERIAILTGRLGDRGVYALHRDGFAAWTITQDWGDGLPSHRLDLALLVAVTSGARDALWRTVLSVDLVGTVQVSNLAPDDPLPYLLSDPRIVRYRARWDHLWLHVLDVARAFGARRFPGDDEFVVETDGRRWRVDADECRPAGRRRPDLVVERSAIGALVMGAVSPTALAAAGRLEASTAEVLDRADRWFTVFPAPHCTTPF